MGAIRSRGSGFLNGAGALMRKTPERPLLPGEDTVPQKRTLARPRCTPFSGVRPPEHEPVPISHPSVGPLQQPSGLRRSLGPRKQSSHPRTVQRLCHRRERIRGAHGRESGPPLPPSISHLWRAQPLYQASTESYRGPPPLISEKYSTNHTVIN